MYSIRTLIIFTLCVSIVCIPTLAAFAKYERSNVDMTDKANSNSSIFEKIESQGGNEIRDEELKDKKGEFWGTAAMIGSGAIGGASVYTAGYALGWHDWDWSEFAGHTAGGVVAASSGIAGGYFGGMTSTIGTVGGEAIGGFIGSVGGFFTEHYVSSWF